MKHDDFKQPELTWKRNRFWPIRLLFNKTIHGDLDGKLIEAAKLGRSDKIGDWLRKGANIHATDDLALKEAASADHRNTVAVLLYYGANPDKLPDGSLSPREYFDYLNIPKLEKNKSSFDPG